MKDHRRGLAPHWLALHFAQHAVRWARERDAPQSALGVLQTAAYHTSLATAAGNVCTQLSEIAFDDGADEATTRQRLLASGVVGTPASPGAMPLILDDEGRLYLHRYFDYERRLAARLTMRIGTPIDAAADARLAGRLDDLFDGNARTLGGRPDWQKVAAALACMGTLTIISGGPGTGKTTTVVKLLDCLLEQDPACRIALAAPTGRAAGRMLEAIRARAGHLPPDLLARLPSTSFTVHRLLGTTSDAGAFRHHAANPLPIDVLVVDEASMLDLALATKLFDAVPPAARIVLLGDKDQLAAVESGAVFSELCADPTLGAACIARIVALTAIPPERIEPSPPVQRTPLHDHVVWFTENFRFAKDSGIGRLAADINAGETTRALAWLRGGEEPAVAWIEDAGATPAHDTLAKIRDAYTAYANAVRADTANRTAIFDAYGRFRVLCAERDGPRGTGGINEAVSRALRPSFLDPFDDSVGHPLAADPRSLWYSGRPVMALRNDHVLKVYNGDIGIVLPDHSGELKVFFPDGDAGFRAVSRSRLPEHETAFATTVHKAQGSEFNEVLLMLPAQPSRVVSRELLYTAVTRSRARVTIVGGESVLERAIASPTRRHSGLLARLREHATQASGMGAPAALP